MSIYKTVNVSLSLKNELNANVIRWLNGLSKYVDQKSSFEFLYNYLKTNLKIFESLDISENLLEAILLGLSSNNWDDAIVDFNESQGKLYNFYLGPMKAMETDNAEIGFVLLKKDEDSSYLQSVIDCNASQLGENGTNYRDINGDRFVEYYKVIYMAGPLNKPKVDRVHIAIFSPFYFSGWSDDAKVMKNRRTILLINIIRERFTHLTKIVANNHILFDGVAPVFSLIPMNIEKLALSTWVGMHELMHTVGPLPLFKEPHNKLELKLYYAGIEETRVDMSVYRSVIRSGEMFGFLSSIIKQIIICERLTRSFRVSYDPVYTHKDRLCRTADGETGSIWISMLSRGGAIEYRKNGVLNINMDICDVLVQKTLNFLHQKECEASVSIDVKGALKNCADLFREKYFVSCKDGYRLDENISEYHSIIQSYPSNMRYEYST